MQCSIPQVPLRLQFIPNFDGLVWDLDIFIGSCTAISDGKDGKVCVRRNEKSCPRVPDAHFNHGMPMPNDKENQRDSA